jgi:serine/threonine protein kinase
MLSSSLLFSPFLLLFLLANDVSGTSGYWAPEVLAKEKYAYPADWWSLGVVFYELLMGMGPFSRRTTGMTSRDDGTKSYEVKYDTSTRLKEACGPHHNNGVPQFNNVVAVISSLLNRDPKKRCNMEKLRATELYKGYDWHALRVHSMKSPFLPDKNGAINAENAQDIAVAAMAKRDSFHSVKLDVTDDFPNIWCVASYQHQKDIVEVLEMERTGKLEHLEVAAGGCCVIL